MLDVRTEILDGAWSLFFIYPNRDDGWMCPPEADPDPSGLRAGPATR